MQNRKQATFIVAYDGPDHGHHEMNIVTLGHSLAALGTALQEANRVINGDDLELKISVSADFEPGSFGVQVLVDMIPYVTDAKNVLEILGITVGASATASTLFNVLSWMRGRRITAIEDPDRHFAQGIDLKSVHVGEEVITCRAEIADLLIDPIFRGAIQDLITSPLQNEGTTSFQIKRDMDSKPTILIEKMEADSFRKPKLAREKKTSDSEKKVNSLLLIFRKLLGGKWSLTATFIACK